MKTLIATLLLAAALAPQAAFALSNRLADESARTAVAPGFVALPGTHDAIFTGETPPATPIPAASEKAVAPRTVRASLGGPRVKPLSFVCGEWELTALGTRVQRCEWK